MPCYRCQQDFSLFLRSHGCGVCKFVYCSKCCNHWLKSDGEKKRVCEQCHRKLTNSSASDVHPAVNVQQHLPPAYSTVPAAQAISVSPALGEIGGGGSSAQAQHTGGRSPASGRAALTPAQIQTIQSLPPSQRKAAETRLLTAIGAQAPKKKAPSSPNIDRSVFQHLPPSQRKAAEARAEHEAKFAKEPQDAVLQQRLADLKQRPDTRTGDSNIGKATTVAPVAAPGTEQSSEQAESGDVAADDIEGRLARLMGVDKSVLAGRSERATFQQPPKRTADEEVDLLLNETNEEVALDKILEVQDKNLHARLGNLRGGSPGPQPAATVASNDVNLVNMTSLDTVGGNAAPTVGSEAATLLNDLMALSKKEQAAADDALIADAELMARVAKLSAQAGTSAATTTGGEASGGGGGGGETGGANVALDAEVAQALSFQDTFGLSDDEDEDDDDDDDEGTGVNRLLEKLRHEAMLDEKLEKAGLSGVLRSHEAAVGGEAQAPPSAAAASATSSAVADDVAKPPPSAHTAQPQRQPQRQPQVAAYSDPYKEEGELPWCCICNNNAVLRCLDCDNELYCKRCFVDGHREFALHDHQIVEYRPPPSRQER